MQVTELSARLLAYVNYGIADTLPTGTTGWLVDAICGAVSDIADASPRYFETRLAGVFAAPAAVSVTIDATDAWKLVPATSGVLRVLGTVRIPGGVQDFQVATYAHPNATIAPGWSGTLGVTLSARAFHDAVAVSGTVRIDKATVVEVGGVELRRVSSRQAAMDEFETALDTGTATDAAPEVWWEERDATASYVCVYPLPAIKMGYAVRGTRVIATLATSAVLASTETYGLEDAVARDIWVPLAAQRFAASPLMANNAAREEIGRQAAAALARCQALAPKRRMLPAWNTRRVTRNAWNTRRVTRNSW